MRMLTTPLRLLITPKLNNICGKRGKIVEVHMSFNPGHDVMQPIQIRIEYKQSEMVAVSCNSALIDHFLAKVKMNQAKLTWINYAHDLKVFFHTIHQCQRSRFCDRFLSLVPGAVSGLGSAFGCSDTNSRLVLPRIPQPTSPGWPLLGGISPRALQLHSSVFCLCN